MSLPPWKAQLQALAREPDRHQRAALCQAILTQLPSPLALTALDACLAQDFQDLDRGLLWAGAAAWALQQGRYPVALEAEQKSQKTRYPLAAQAWINLARWENGRQTTPPAWLQSDQAAAMPDVWLQAWVHALLAAGHTTAAEHLLEKSLVRSEQGLTIQLLGGLYEQKGDYFKALAIYQRQPEQPEIIMRQAEVLKNLGQTAEAAHLLQAYLTQAPAPQQVPEKTLFEARLHSQYLLCLTSLASPQDGQIEAEKAKWAARHRPNDAPLPAHPSPSQAPAKAKLRLGFLAPDFGSHSIYPLIQALFANHNRATFELYAYAGKTREDVATAQLQATGVHWRDLAGHSPRQIAEVIQRDRLDILLDASGHTSLHLLPVFYYRPAPIQISGLCFAEGTGLPDFDYLLTDPLCSQTGARSSQELPPSEKPLPLASWLFWFPPPQNVPLSEPQGPPQLGCAHHPGRLSLEICALWAEILNRHPDTELRLKHRCFASPDTQAVFRQRFAQWGIPPERLHFEGASNYLDYLAFYNQLSLALDPFPYHGGLTSAEALWMGVPLLNLRDRQRAMQGGLSLLSQIGHPEWSVDSASAFVATATECLQTPWGLEARQSLRQACEAAPFTQIQVFISGLEDKLKELLGPSQNDKMGLFLP